ncbi:MAG TPA: cytochrome C [Xanthomarina gelatinilytica]|uniref:Cytochrome C n=1 Tax=Xanthomarina gelatinilytica TaxID=1137281 RepID=A0A3D6BPE1_9FLAO|nr:cytochrome C [Xanthomarina gelatinilytica]
MRFLIVILLVSSCKTDKNALKEVKDDSKARTELSQDSKIFLGNRLFSEKTCITCHAIDSKHKAPSVVEIMQVYKAHDADIVAFLKGHAKPIVDTTASQVAIMQDNIDGFLKKITDEELDAIATYMMHVDELSKKQ